MSNDCTFIILGATGDLARRKLIPALYKLVHDRYIDRFLVVGAALESVSADYCLDRAREFIPALNESTWTRLQRSFYYQQLDFNSQEGFVHLAKFVQALEKEHNLQSNRIVYLAVPSTFFCAITRQLGISGLVKKMVAAEDKNQAWQKIVYEKPFGLDLSSAREINECIQQYFYESQVFRVDHYLTKELVSNILLVRFTNIIFAPLWNKDYIDQVQIVLTETLGMEERGKYYDQYGVLKDVVQNHMMQLMALVAMELPDALRASDIHEKKAQVLQKISCKGGFLGQYIGYESEKDIAHNSKTPTFAVLQMAVDNERWQGVPFYLKTGKSLHKKETSISIKFKEVACKLREQCSYTSNYLSISIAPEPSFSIQLNIKQPGILYQTTPANLFFSHNYTFGTATLEAYEVLFEHIIRGDQSVSIRFDEIEYAWKVIDSIENLRLPLYRYQQASEGPQYLQEFNNTHNVKWRS